MTSERNHMPQLDGLRAFAFLAVAFSHWIPESLQLGIPLGTGVQLFFVLSGFLITGILLRNRPDESGLKTSNVLRAFYVRRVLRIFPLYYGVLAVCLFLNVAPIRDTWPWHAAYLSNFFYAKSDVAYADSYLHFWSLSIEEQFYLFWPLIALVVPPKSLRFVIVGAIVGALAFRIGIGSVGADAWAVRYLTPSCFDALGVGALLAYARHYHGLDGLRRAKVGAAVIGLVGLVLTVPLSGWIGSRVAHWAGHTFLIIFYGAIVAQAAEGFRGVLGLVLGAPPVRYMGKISYGLYVYHHFAPVAVAAVVASLGLSAERWLAFPSNLVPYLAFSLLVAMLSWHFYESRFLRLKRGFEYRSASTKVPGIAAPVVTPPSV